MRNIKVKKSSNGNTSARFVLLILPLAGLGTEEEYRMGTPGSTIVDRLRAKPVVVDIRTPG